MTTLLLFACILPTDSGKLDSPVACAELDCRDALTLVVLGVDGAPSDGFGGQVTDADGVTTPFDCWVGDETSSGSMCLGEGKVQLWTYSPTYEVSAFEGLDAPSFFGTLTPTWTAPYDSEECGHYCYIAEETVQLEPCDGCG